MGNERAADGPLARFIDRTLGVIGGSMIAAAFLLLILGGARDDGTPASALPTLTLIAPLPGEALTAPVEVELGVPAGLRRGPSGWESGSFHLHVAVDGMEFMPAVGDVEPVAPGRYRWILPRISPGRHSLRVFWSGGDHRAVTRGDSVEIVVRE